MQYVTIKDLSVSRFIVGSNPFSGFSHQTPDRDMEMRHYYTVATIKETLKSAASLGINTIIARGDHHITRMLMEYWDEGGTLQWICQTCPEVGDSMRCIQTAAAYGAKACFIHGGVMDSHLAKGQTDAVKPWIDMIHEKGMLAGIAGHNPKVHEWAERTQLPVDFHMCSYYNPSNRDKNAEHIPGQKEWFREEDRATMTALIQTLSRPVIHYKVMAAGRNDPQEAFAHVGKSMRANDIVCVGVFPKDKANMIAEDIELLESSLAEV